MDRLIDMSAAGPISNLPRFPTSPRLKAIVAEGGKPLSSSVGKWRALGQRSDGCNPAVVHWPQDSSKHEHDTACWQVCRHLYRLGIDPDLCDVMGRRWREFGVGLEVDHGPAVETDGVFAEGEVD